MFPLRLLLLTPFLRPCLSLATNPSHLHLTALITQPSGAAAFECWRIAQPFTDYPTVGSAITGLADVSNVSYVVLPPRSEEGLHKPPHAMYASPTIAPYSQILRAKQINNRFFILLTGLAHVTLPSDPEGAGLYIVEGVNPLMIAADCWGEGHFTSYPGDKETVALQVPFTDGEMPEHEIVGEGVCGGSGGSGGSGRLGSGLGLRGGDQEVMVGSHA